MKTIRIGKAFLCLHSTGFYGRLANGKGISFEYTNRPPLFSERNGYRKVHRFGGFKMEVLK